ncbi:hypothetical protein KIN20_033254 [Parelaphostrongylus tenuis]|uniref:Uncharacterized protein n=1 Tax=Parelaphostrongylus tenuis TaxID=148309 RepID=A0AAD5WJ24_PARTN|nr:hypothetical protein KIN20_033254 [Parelaphostrongylus tenuis]
MLSLLELFTYQVTYVIHAVHRRRASNECTSSDYDFRNSLVKVLSIPHYQVPLKFVEIEKLLQTVHFFPVLQGQMKTGLIRWTGFFIDGATLPKEPRSSSDANGPKEMKWSAREVFLSSTTHDQ